MKPVCIASYDIVETGGLPSAKISTPSDVARLLRECSHLVLVGPGAWKECRKAWKLLEEQGENPLRLTCLDDEAEPVLAGLDAKTLLFARASSKTLTKTGEAAYRVDTGKPVSRRALLLRGPMGLRHYIPSPILVSPASCSSLRQCRSCVEACPFNALEGKPPTLNPEKCTGCGTCLSACPLRILESSGTSSREQVFYLKQVLPKLQDRKTVVVFSCTLSAHEALEAMLEAKRKNNGDSTALLLVPIHCPGEVVADTLIALVVGGAGVVVYCSGDSLERGKGYEKYLDSVLRPLAATGLVAWAETPQQLATVLGELETRINRKGFDTTVFDWPAAERAIMLTRLLPGTGMPQPETLAPVPATIRVEDELCDLCGACVAECPTNALRVENQGDKQLLVYSPAKCIGCTICEKVCPHQALRAELLLPPPPAHETVLAQDELARCIVCGKPIGSKKLVDRVARIMREKGFPEDMLLTVYMCNECKVKYRLGLIDPRKIPRPAPHDKK